MINLEAPIIPSKSIGSINIGEKFSSYLDYLHNESIQFTREDFNSGLSIIIVERGTIEVTTDSEDVILNISCGKKYNGSCKEKYFVGMSISQILSESERQLILHGFLILDRDFGFGFEIPEEFENCDYAENLPEDFVPERIYVFPENQWG